MLIENTLFEFMSASGEHDGGCYPIVMPDNASFVQGMGFLDRTATKWTCVVWGARWTSNSPETSAPRPSSP